MIINEEKLNTSDISKVISKYILNKKRFIEKKQKLVTNNNAAQKIIDLIKKVKKK
jgi:hypothetical protein